MANDHPADRRHSREDMSESVLRRRYAKNDDVQFERYVYGEIPFVMIYCSGIADRRQISEYVLPSLEHTMSKGILEAVLTDKTLQLQPFDPKLGLPKLDELLFTGFLLLLFGGDRLLMTLDIANPPKRNPEESSIEVSIKGPRDGFTEDLATNVALVRKRLRTPLLCCEAMTIGRKSQTHVVLMYVEDAADPAVVEEARSRLRSVDTDSLVSGEQLEEAMADSAYALLPLVDHTGRPDAVSESVIRGRVVVLAEGNPLAIVAPATLTSLLKSPEDLHLPFYYVSIQRILRLISLIITMTLPGLWVATSAFQLDQIPFPLLATITLTRLGLPLSGPMDLYLMLILFELFREAGVRLPKAVGQTVAVVGGLFVGDAAITAGLTSASALVVSAVTLVTSFTLVNQALTGAVTLIRFVILICSSILGMYGFFIGLFAVLLYMATLECLGVPYLSPLAMARWKLLVPALIIKPWKLVRNRRNAVKPEEPVGGGN